jgi:type VI secretion system ImpM family protein
MSRAEIGLVGKLPASADFVRRGAGSDAFGALYGWLLDGVQSGAAARGDWLRQVSPGAVQAMCFRAPSNGSVLAGALAPSADAAGRRFPIAAAAELTLDAALAEHGEVLPLVLEPLWAATSQLVIELQEVDRAALDAAELAAETDVDLPTALGAYRRWTEELELAELIALVFADDGARAAAALALVEEAVMPYRGIENPDTALSLRLPLGQAGGAAVCFWLDLVERLTGWKRTVPSFFWSHDGESGALLLHLGRAAPVALAELWLPTGACDQVCDVIVPAQLWAARGLSRWQRTIVDTRLPVAELLRALPPKSPRG